MYIIEATNLSGKAVVVTDQKRKQQIKEIYERQIDRVYRISLMFTGDPHDAEDVAESVFLTVIEKAITFENEEHEKAWFITATRNRCKDLYKSVWKDRVQLGERAELSADAEDTFAGTADSGGDPGELRSEAERLLMTLPRERREAVYLCYYEGYTLKEAAMMMGTTETKVRSALQAAKKQLRGKRDE